MTATTPDVRLAAGLWVAIVDRTSATFTVSNLGFKVVHGRVAVTRGEVEVDRSGIPVGMRAELDLDTVDTGIARRDLDLRKRSLLDVDDHPVMTYTADSITRDSSGWRADGVLTLRGTSCPLVLCGAVLADSTGDAVHVLATATLDRTAVGIRAPSLMIGRTVTITIDAWLAGTVPG
ncbi:YceI family protein [Blastococcus sp. CT_GayMR19]|uniref:YceI family protein n=1 Tax=Blastococcus sp. CT_GayMR19 TaxID=2559608 RepID=UPI001073B91D|nr:YceI family protein [Blastococcus sp. CT_GayMR19]TFV72248.1 YceI family protein [Blastococcus sp. CT_GayMR19]